MGMKDRSLIDKINQIFIALPATTIHHSLMPWKTGKYKVPSELAPRGGVHNKYDARDGNHADNNALTDVFCCSNMDICVSLAEVPAKRIDNI